LLHFRTVQCAHIIGTDDQSVCMLYSVRNDYSILLRLLHWRSDLNSNMGFFWKKVKPTTPRQHDLNIC